MIKSFSHKGVKKFYDSGSMAGIQSAHAPKLARQLARLNQAKTPADMNLPGWKLHPLKGKLVGQWAISVSGNWRLIFRFRGGDVFNVDYDDYH
ncbi:MAG: type II toxin-antitoxin system RelE/ParE family toxin [Proteobacteria bacterium]|nr:type II toxin-antitoxin system RelE/ParE family toxin [Pseudomonadota bacterium]